QAAVFQQARYVPDQGRSVLTSGNQGPAVRGKGQGRHVPAMPRQATDFFPGGQLPEVDLPAEGSGQGPPVGGKGERSHPRLVMVPPELVKLFPRGHVPNPSHVPMAACGQPLPVRGEDEDRASREVAQLLARSDVPEVDGFVPTSAGQGAAVGGKRDTRHPPLVRLESARLLSRGYVPQTCSPVPTAGG